MNTLPESIEIANYGLCESEGMAGNQDHGPSGNDGKPASIAEAYLQKTHGFDLSRIRTWYSQESYYSPEVGIGAVTVRFYLNQARSAYWEHLIENTVKLGRQDNFSGDWRKHWWAPPGQELGEGDAVWLTTKIFDAIALAHHGLKVIAMLDCDHYPTQLVEHYRNRNIRWVFALGNDEANEKTILACVRQAIGDGESACVAQGPRDGVMGVDWNTCHLEGQLTDEDLDEYLHRGALLVAKEPKEKALLIYKRQGLDEFPFEHRRRLFWFELDRKEYDQALVDSDTTADEESYQIDAALKQAAKIFELANCYPQALYFQENKTTNESWYYFRVSFPDNHLPAKNTFTGSQIASASEFKKRLLSIGAGAIFRGKTHQLDRFLKWQIQGIKRVDTIDYIGYSKEHGCYLFPEIAVKDGEVYPMNGEDYFDLPHLNIKSISHVSLDINPIDQGYHSDWPDQVYRCWGAKGIVATAFWLGCLFAEQIRERDKSFPFLEVIGEPGSGKTTLIEFLWKLLGRSDYEGFDASMSSIVGRARQFAQVSNLPVVLLESDRDEDTAKHKRFDWEETKTLFNGRIGRFTGVKNQGTDTYGPPFRGGLVITQNAAVNASEAILTRIVHLHMTRKNQNDQSKREAEALERLQVEDVSNFIIQAIGQEAAILQTFFDHHRSHEKHLYEHCGVKNYRIAKCHGQIMALVDALDSLVSLPAGAAQSARDELKMMATARQEAIGADHPIVEQFWEAVEHIRFKNLNHHNWTENDQRIAINLNHFQSKAAKLGLKTPTVLELKRHLKSSRKRKFICSNTVVNSICEDGKFLNPDYTNLEYRVDKYLYPYKEKSVRCWIFRGPADPESEEA